VPYKGGSPAYPDVFTGRVSLMLDPMSASMPNVKAGKVKAIAVTSPTRASSAPEIPAVAETIPGFSVQSISGIVVPNATPRELVRQISVDVGKALQSADLKVRMVEVGMEPAATTPEQFDAFIRTEIDKMAKVVKSSGARVDD
jgi:tripartite-type tricarboxylate transporter receptor subunit TctC